MQYRHFGARPALPLVVEPTTAAEASRLHFLSSIANDRSFLAEQLLVYGALLFRGFELDDDETFEAAARLFVPQLLNYVEGNSPRTAVSPAIYTSTEYPATEFISLHNELSYTHAPPRRLFFSCRTAPLAGGETPIADCRAVLEALDEDLVERFETRGICYIQNMHEGHGLGRSWQETFEASDRAVVERCLTERGVDFEWKAGGGLWTCQLRPAVVRHPETGDRLWFNQANQWHISSLNARARAALTAAYAPDDYPLHALHGDGSEIMESDLDQVRAAFAKCMVAFTWKPRDLLVIDNYRVAHGRNPFEGPRAIRVAMG